MDVCQTLFEISQDPRVLDPDCELLDSGILDSYVFIELFSILEEEGIEIYPTRIDHDRLRTPRSIQTLIAEYQ